MEVRIKKLQPGIQLPEYQTGGAAGFDLASSENVAIPPKMHRLVGTGLAIETPEGYMLMLTPRSSLFKRTGLVMANSVGIVDADYSGDEDEVKLSLLNTTSSVVQIIKGERLANGLFVPVSRVDFLSVDSLGRSRGGFGSTGI